MISYLFEILLGHFEIVSIKTSRVIGFLRYAKSFLLQESLKITYTCIVKRHVYSCCPVWDSCGWTEINQLQNYKSVLPVLQLEAALTPLGQPLIKKLGCKRASLVASLVGGESEVMVWRSPQELAPKYTCNHFTKRSHRPLGILGIQQLT